MQFRINAIVAAAALAAVGSANAALSFGNATTFGNSSAAFVAMDNGGNISLTVDIGVSFADFLAATPGITASAGMLSAPGTVAQWNLASNTLTVNGNAVAGTYSWSGVVGGFLGNGNVTGNGYKWGVVAGDSIPGAQSASNTIRGNNILFTTGLPQDFDNSDDTGINAAVVSNGATNVTNLFASGNTATGNTHGSNTSVHGANTATGGTAFLGTTMANGGQGNFGQQFGANDYLTNPGDVANFMWVNQGNPTNMYSIGAVNALGEVAANPATWAWDESSKTLTYSVPTMPVPVPEPGTYALFGAGLALLAARRVSSKR